MQEQTEDSSTDAQQNALNDAVRDVRQRQQRQEQMYQQQSRVTKFAGTVQIEMPVSCSEETGSTIAEDDVTTTTTTESTSVASSSDRSRPPSATTATARRGSSFYGQPIHMERRRSMDLHRRSIYTDNEPFQPCAAFDIDSDVVTCGPAAASAAAIVPAVVPLSTRRRSAHQDERPAPPPLPPPSANRRDSIYAYDYRRPSIYDVRRPSIFAAIDARRPSMYAAQDNAQRASIYDARRGSMYQAAAGDARRPSYVYDATVRRPSIFATRRMSMAPDDERRLSMANDDSDAELANMRPHHTLTNVVSLKVNVLFGRITKQQLMNRFLRLFRPNYRVSAWQLIVQRSFACDSICAIALAH